MRGFLNWCSRYTKNKIYKIIFFIILFLLISYLTNACDVHATTFLLQDTARIYTESQKCTTNNNSLSCVKGTAYKFQYDYNTTKSGNSYQFDMILNNFDYSQLFQNIIYDYSISDTFTIDSTHRSLYIMLPYSDSQFQLGSGTGSSNTTFSINMFPQNSLNPNTNEIDRHFTFPMNYNFKPYYCSYVDVSDNQTKPCNVILDIDSGNVWKYVADIPLNTTINRITFYFGTNQLYSGSLKIQTYGVYNISIPDNENIGYLHTTNNNTLYAINYVNFNTYRQRSNSNNIGIWYYPQGYTIQTPKFQVPNNQFEIGYDNVDYRGNTYKWTYTNLSSSQLEQLNSTLGNIEQDIIDQQGSDNWFDDSMSGFTNSEQANSFIQIFNAIVTYPLQKFSDQLDEGLTNNQGLNLALCTGRNLIGGINENRIQIPLYKGVKFDFPCLHYDVYSKMYNDDYGFYPTTLNDVSISGGRSNNFYSIYRLIIRGFLIYCLYLTCLDAYKYILDSDRKEIEVLDL